MQQKRFQKHSTNETDRPNCSKSTSWSATFEVFNNPLVLQPLKMDIYWSSYVCPAGSQQCSLFFQKLVTSKTFVLVLMPTFSGHEQTSTQVRGSSVRQVMIKLPSNKQKFICHAYVNTSMSTFVITCQAVMLEEVRMAHN